MVTYYNKKDLIDFGSFLLTKGIKLGPLETENKAKLELIFGEWLMNQKGIKTVDAESSSLLVSIEKKEGLHVFNVRCESTHKVIHLGDTNGCIYLAMLNGQKLELRRAQFTFKITVEDPSAASVKTAIEEALKGNIMEVKIIGVDQV